MPKQTNMDRAAEALRNLTSPKLAVELDNFRALATLDYLANHVEFDSREGVAERVLQNALLEIADKMKMR